MIQYLIVFLFLLVVSLYMVYTSLSDTNIRYKFPPQIPACPDYYTVDYDTGKCKDITKLFYEPDHKCFEENFNKPEYKVKGNDLNSGICRKKLWANNCRLKWDGITNNNTICID